jgi:hypothetical protein
VALNIAFLLRTANSVWSALDFYGEATGAAELRVEQLQPYRATAGFHLIVYNLEVFLVP